MQYSSLAESFPQLPAGEPAPVPAPRPNGGWFGGYVVPEGAGWGSVPVTPTVGGLMARVRADGEGLPAAVLEGTYHYPAGSVRPGNHAPPDGPGAGLVRCNGSLCVDPAVLGKLLPR